MPGIVETRRNRASKGLKSAGVLVVAAAFLIATRTITINASPLITNVQAGLGVGAGPDTDGDGFSDSLETVAGSDPANAASTPTGQALTPAGILPLTVSRISVKLNRSKPQTDMITVSGTVAIPAGFSPLGQTVILDVSGVTRKFVLDAKGMSKINNDMLKIAIRSKKGVVSAQTSAFTMTLKNGSFGMALSNYAGLVDGNFNKVPKTIVVAMIINNTVLQKAQAVTYTDKLGKVGTAK